MTTANNSSNKRQNTYSNGALRSYDGLASSMAVGFFNEVGVIDIAPINPQFVGKTPEKGDKVYNYDDKLKVYISADAAQGILAAINHLEALVNYAAEDSEFEAPKSISYEFGDKTFTLRAPGAKLRINGERPDLTNNYVIMFSIPDEDGNAVNVTHVLQVANTTLTYADKSTEELVLQTGLMNLKTFLAEIINLGTGSYRQGAALAAPKGGTSGKTTSEKSKGFGSILNEDDDFDDEENGDEEVKSSKPATTARKTLKPAGKKPVAKADIDDEFED